MRTREWLNRLVLVGVSLLLTTAAAELGLRLWWGNGLTQDQLRARLESSREASPEEATGRFGLFGLVQASDDPDVVYELKPGLAGTFHGEPVRTNSFGLRDDETTLEKPPGTFRIVGLGDSHMFGWGVAQGETYLDELEKALDADGTRRFEVLNCAAPGYNTTMEVAVFAHKCRAFSPDLVILHFVGNDFGLPHFMQPPRKLSSVADWYVVELLKAVFVDQPAADEMPELLPHDRSDLPLELRRESQSQYAHMRGVEAFRRALERLAELTRDPPVPVIFSIVGTGSDERGEVAAIAEEMGFTVVDLSSTLGAYMAAHQIEPTTQNFRQLFQIPHDGHPSALAHRLYAEPLVAPVRAIAARAAKPPAGPS